ncbi:MAG: hypothetical protein IPN69_00895 [Acidobacteria bacterium]|nr:hypothetical protein [Acidobacteriota bacterium]
MPNQLPRLTANHNVPIARRGRFLEVTADTLLAISDGLETRPTTTHINSIPDVWARLLLFENALFDENHRLHPVVMGEWRGMLALLALREIKHLNLLASVPFSLEGDPADRNLIWHSSLLKLVPSTQIYENTTWRNLFLFLVDGRPIGVTSPTTLIATGTHYPVLTIPRAQVIWYNQTQLTDPLQHEISPIDREGLASWLHNLYTNLQPQPTRDGDRGNKLLGLIRNFRDDLTQNPLPFIPSEFGFGISGVKAGVFTLLDKPTKPREIPPTHSCVRLLPSNDRIPAIPMLIADPDIAEQWQLNPQTILIHRNLTLGSIPYEGLAPNQHDRIGNTIFADAEIWRPQDLLTEKIYYLQQKRAFPGASLENWPGNPPNLNGRDISIVLPLNKVLLNHLNPTDILTNLVFSQNNNGEIIVKFTVRLSGIDNHPRNYQIEKIYKRDDMEPIEQSPILEIFPNFTSEIWQAYYIAYSTDNLNDTFQIDPVSADSDPVDLNISHNQGGSRKIWRLGKFPEAFACTMRQPGSNQLAEIGMLLIPTPEKAPVPNRNFTVGVDFGASGTMIYYSDGNQKIPLKFSNLKLRVTEISDTQEAEILKFFLPKDEIIPSFLTIYQDFNNYDGEAQTMLHGHIYYLFGLVLDLSDDDIYTNLKWSAAANTNYRVKSFLAQVCLQASAELAVLGAGAITWRYSFPTAFSPAQATNFNQTWQQIVNTNSELTGIRSVGPPTDLSESIASAECFRNGGASLNGDPAPTVTGAVFIDIGGSTSDISIWQEDSLRLQLSLRYAGRDIFLNYLWGHLDVFDVFKIDTTDLRNLRENREKFWSQADSVLRNNSNRIFHDLPAHFEDDRLEPLKQYLTVGMAGLFYYLGLNIKHLMNRNRYAPDMPHIYFGGNGSQMFRWLCSGASITNSHPLVKLFEKVFQAAVSSSLRGTFNLTMSERLKHESAYGLVSPPQLIVPDEEILIISGEDFVHDEAPYSWDHELDPEFLDGTFRPPASFGNLTAFVESFNEFARPSRGLVQTIELTTEVLDSVNRRVDTRLADASEQKVVFILALRSLLETLGRSDSQILPDTKWLILYSIILAVVGCSLFIVGRKYPLNKLFKRKISRNITDELTNAANWVKTINNHLDNIVPNQSSNALSLNEERSLQEELKILNSELRQINLKVQKIKDLYRPQMTKLDQSQKTFGKTSPSNETSIYIAETERPISNQGPYVGYTESHHNQTTSFLDPSGEESRYKTIVVPYDDPRRDFIDLYNLSVDDRTKRQDFWAKYQNTHRFGNKNAYAQARGETTEFDFRSKDSGEFLAVKLSNEPNHLVVPIFGTTISETSFNEGGFGRVYNCPNYQSGHSHALSEIIRPAEFSQNGDQWVLINTGELSLKV